MCVCERVCGVSNGCGKEKKVTVIVMVMVMGRIYVYTCACVKEKAAVEGVDMSLCLRKQEVSFL
jgi:hypothetical protein